MPIPRGVTIWTKMAISRKMYEIHSDYRITIKIHADALISAVRWSSPQRRLVEGFAAFPLMLVTTADSRIPQSCRVAEGGSANIIHDRFLSRGARVDMDWVGIINSRFLNSCFADLRVGGGMGVCAEVGGG